MILSKGKVSKTLVITIFAIIFSFFSFTLVSAQSDLEKENSTLKEACLTAPDSVFCEEINKSGDPGKTGGFIAVAINIFSYIVGIAAVIVIMVAGLTYILSSGDSNATKQSRDAIIYAAIGLIVVLIAQGIVRFFVSGVT